MIIKHFLIVLIGIFILYPSPSTLGAETPQTFTYQGRFFNASGTAPLQDVVDLTLGILDPTGTCLLYEEHQSNIDLTRSMGIFVVQVGSVVTSPKRTSLDPGLSMSQIFANRGSVASHPASCPGGYTPAAGDSRKLRITVIPQSTGIPTTLVPDQAINATPQSQVADTLQGLAPQDFIQASGTVSQLALGRLTDGSDALSLHHHDSRYVRTDGSSSVSGLTIAPQATLGLGTYTTAQESGIGLGPSDVGRTWYNSDTNEIKYWDGSAIRALGAAGSGISSLNGSTSSSQTFAVSTAGASLAWSMAGSTHTLNIPTASGTTTGLLSSSAFQSFSGKEDTLTFSAPLSRSGQNVSIPQASAVSDGYLSSGDFISLSNKQASGDYISALTGDIAASGPAGGGSASATLANVGTAGTYTKVTTDAKGRVTAGESLAAGDIPDLSWNKITSDKPTTLSGYGITDSLVANAGGTPSIASGDEAARPAAGNSGRVYIASDTFKIFRDNGATWDLIASAAGAGGSVTSVSGTGPISVINGSSTPEISIATANGSTTGALSSADWTTFNNKESALTFNGPLSRSGNTISIPAATSIADGYLSAADFLTFNNKLSAVAGSSLNSAQFWVGNGTNQAAAVAMSGDASLSNSGALTLNTVGIAKGGTGATTKAGAFDALSPVTTKGDLIVRDGSSNVRLPAGDNDQVLMADSSQASGLKWAPVPSAPVSSVAGKTGAVTLEKADVGLGNVENTTLSTWAGSSNIATVGTITSGTWNGTTIAIARGGTGATTAAGAANNILPAQATHSGKFLTTDGTNVSWLSVPAAPVTSVAGKTGAVTLEKADVGLSNVENTALSTWAGSSNITTVGTITTGTWDGTAIAIAKGGTGATTQTAAFNALSPVTTKGDLIVRDGSNNIRLPAGGNGQVLTSDSAEPSGLKWSTAASGTVTNVTGSGPISVINNSTTPAISIATANGSTTGALSSADWTTFNNKESALTFDGPLSRSGNTISIPAASGGSSGYLTAADFLTFNNKLGAVAGSSLNSAQFWVGNGTNQAAAVTMSGDASLSNSGALTLNTVGIAKGGTGATTAAGAANNILPAQATHGGKVLTTDGTNVSWVTPAAAPVTSVAGKTGAVTLVKGDVGLGNVENTALSTWAGSSNITTIGAITSGTWNGTTIALARGGTGATTQAAAANNILPSQATHSGKVLTTDGTNVSWVAPAAAPVTSVAGKTGAVTLEKADVGLGNVENTALSTWAGSSNITTVGTITTGTWDGTAIAIAKGGTGATTAQGAINAISQLTTKGDILVRNTTNSTRLPVGTNGQILTADSAQATGLVWVTPSFGTVTSVSGNGPISVATGTTTPSISIATANGSTTGALSSTDWTTFNNKLGAVAGSSLNSAQFWVGNGTNQATAVAMSGDATLSNTGALTLSTVAIAKGGTGATTAAGAANNILPSQSTHGGKFLTTDGSNVSWSTVSSSQWTTTGSDIYYNTGKVGMGTTAPAFRLDARGANAKATTAAYETIFQAASTDAASPLALRMGIKTDATDTNRYGALEVDDAGTKRHLAFQPTAGNMGIGMIAPSEKLEVNGNIKATAFLYSSDKRLKDEIEPIGNALERVLALQGVTFRWKDGGQKTCGFIAQDVEKVFPELVTTSESTGLKSVHYGNLVAVLVEALREQQDQIDEQRRRADALEKRLERIERALASEKR